MKFTKRINLKVLIILMFIPLVFNFCNKKEELEILSVHGQKGTLTDVDGNIYNWVGIGNQIWMSENLKVTKYQNADGTAGNSIPLIEDYTEWRDLADNNLDKAYCYYNNNANGEKEAYGALYTYAAAINETPYNKEISPNHIQGICPTGWHVPSNDEWLELENFVASEGYNGEISVALKVTTGWNDYNGENSNGTDKYSFSAKAGGFRFGNWEGDNQLGNYGTWWCSDESTENKAFWVDMSNSRTDNYHDSGLKSFGYSVRCIKD